MFGGQERHSIFISSQINSLGKNYIFKVEKSGKHQAKQVTRVYINSEPTDTLGFFFLVSLKMSINIADLQCCVNFCCIAVIQLYIYTHSFSCKFNRQGDNTQPRHTPLPILTQAVVPCLVLTVAS